MHYRHGVAMFPRAGTYLSTEVSDYIIIVIIAHASTLASSAAADIPLEATASQQPVRTTIIRYSGTLTCMTASAEALKQLNTLLAEHAKLVRRAQFPDLSDLRSEIRVLANRLQAAIDRLTVPTSTHGRAAEMQRANEEPYVAA
jgi:hypothetical protein